MKGFMHHFENGEAAKVIRHGEEMEVIVFRQLGEFVYAFDNKNRVYLFRATDVAPMRVPSGPAPGIHPAIGQRDYLSSHGLK